MDLSHRLVFFMLCTTLADIDAVGQESLEGTLLLFRIHGNGGEIKKEGQPGHLVTGQPTRGGPCLPTRCSHVGTLGVLNGQQWLRRREER